MYINLDEYNQITGRPIIEATPSRIKRASYLLDARIGNYINQYDGWKLDLTDTDCVTAHQANIVKEWVAYMIAFLFDNNDSSPMSGNIKLGRFSFSGKEDSQSSSLIPEELQYADVILAGSGLVKRRVKLS